MSCFICCAEETIAGFCTLAEAEAFERDDTLRPGLHICHECFEIEDLHLMVFDEFTRRGIPLLPEPK